MTLARELAARHDELVEAMLQQLRPDESMPDTHKRQFLNGFLHIVKEASEGRGHAIDDYIDLVIPGCHANGICLDHAMENNTSVCLVLVSVLRPEHHDFLIGFGRQFAKNWILRWQAH
jgi:hypothetical protein